MAAYAPNRIYTLPGPRGKRVDQCLKFVNVWPPVRHPDHPNFAADVRADWKTYGGAVVYIMPPAEAQLVADGIDSHVTRVWGLTGGIHGLAMSREERTGHLINGPINHTREPWRVRSQPLLAQMFRTLGGLDKAALLATSMDRMGIIPAAEWAQISKGLRASINTHVDQTARERRDKTNTVLQCVVNLFCSMDINAGGTVVFPTLGPYLDKLALSANGWVDKRFMIPWERVPVGNLIHCAQGQCVVWPNGMAHQGLHPRAAITRLTVTVSMIARDTMSPGAMEKHHRYFSECFVTGHRVFNGVLGSIPMHTDAARRVLIDTRNRNDKAIALAGRQHELYTAIVCLPISQARIKAIVQAVSLDVAAERARRSAAEEKVRVEAIARHRDRSDNCATLEYLAGPDNYNAACVARKLVAVLKARAAGIEPTPEIAAALRALMGPPAAVAATTSTHKRPLTPPAAPPPHGRRDRHHHHGHHHHGHNHRHHHHHQPAILKKRPLSPESEPSTAPKRPKRPTTTTIAVTTTPKPPIETVAQTATAAATTKGTGAVYKNSRAKAVKRKIRTDKQTVVVLVSAANRCAECHYMKGVGLAGVRRGYGMCICPNP